MPPLPKQMEKRQRMNRPGSHADLPAKPPRIRAPKLPQRWRMVDGERVEVPWHEMTVRMWRDLWRSPMAVEFIQMDHHGLYLLADATDRYWWTGNEKLLAEIARLRKDFGLTPLDRRRLEWHIQKEPPKAKVEAESVVPLSEDLRRLLATA